MEKPSNKRSSDLGDIQAAIKAENHPSVKTWRLEGQQEIERDASTNLLKIMKTAKLLNDACDLLTELEHYSEDDYVNYRLDELFREVVKLDESNIPHPAGDWSPLYELTAQLQTQYNVTAPPNIAGIIL